MRYAMLVWSLMLVGATIYITIFLLLPWRDVREETVQFSSTFREEIQEQHPGITFKQWDASFSETLGNTLPESTFHTASTPALFMGLFKDESSHIDVFVEGGRRVTVTYVAETKDLDYLSPDSLVVHTEWFAPLPSSKFWNAENPSFKQAMFLYDNRDEANSLLMIIVTLGTVFLIVGNVILFTLRPLRTVEN